MVVLELGNFSAFVTDASDIGKRDAAAFQHLADLSQCRRQCFAQCFNAQSITVVVAHDNYGPVGGQRLVDQRQCLVGFMVIGHCAEFTSAGGHGCSAACPARRRIGFGLPVFVNGILLFLCVGGHLHGFFCDRTPVGEIPPHGCAGEHGLLTQCHDILNDLIVADALLLDNDSRGDPVVFLMIDTQPHLVKNFRLWHTHDL